MAWLPRPASAAACLLALGCAVPVCGLGGEPGGLWDWRGRGDVRAVVDVAAGDLRRAGAGLSAVIEWRRRDAEPGQKAVIVTDSAGNVVANATAPVVEQHRGVVVFTPHAKPQT